MPYLRFVDRDIVSRSDLHRQHLYDAESLGRPKVEVAFNKLSRLNPDVALEPVPESLNSANAEELIAGMDVVIDGLDRPEPRYIVNRVCNKLKIPYVFGAAIEAFGNVSTILPCTLADAKLDEVFANAFWITVIVKMPGARNVINGTPMTSPRCDPIAIVKIIKNKPALISGAMTVCDQTFIKRRISRRTSVHVPSQFTRPKRRTPIWIGSFILNSFCGALLIADWRRNARVRRPNRRAKTRTCVKAPSLASHRWLQ